MTIELVFPVEQQMKGLEVGGTMGVPYDAILRDDSIEIRLTIDVIDAHVRCTACSVRADDGQGLEHRTAEVFRGMRLDISERQLYRLVKSARERGSCRWKRRADMASIQKRPDGRYRVRWREYPGAPERSRHFDRKIDA